MDIERLKSKLSFRTSRSSGPGGQAVNKSETRVEVVLNIVDAGLFSEDELALVQTRLRNRINKAGELALAASDSRSQHENKELVIERLILLIQNALKVKKPRKLTKPTKTSVEKRKKSKSERSDLKKGRGWRFDV